MMAIVAPLLFLFAMMFAGFTIAAMLASHGGKMIAALRMDRRPRHRGRARPLVRGAMHPRRGVAPGYVVSKPSRIGVLRAA